jgi:hypothetical protein
MDRIDPIGTWRDDFRMASILSTVVNITRTLHGKKGIPMTNPIDFMPDWDFGKSKSVKRQSVEEMKAALMSLARSQEKTVKREKILDANKTVKRLPTNKKTVK